MTAQARFRIAVGLALLLLSIGLPASWKALANTDHSADGLTPGLWQSRLQIETLDIPGLPPGMVQKMAQEPSVAEPRRSCVKADQEGRPDETLLHRLGGSCHYTDWKAREGRIEATLACKPPGAAPGTASIVLSGSYDEARFSLTSITEATSVDGQRQMHMRARIEGEREGVCP